MRRSGTWLSRRAREAPDRAKRPRRCLYRGHDARALPPILLLRRHCRRLHLRGMANTARRQASNHQAERAEHSWLPTSCAPRRPRRKRHVAAFHCDLRDRLDAARAHDPRKADGRADGETSWRHHRRAAWQGRRGGSREARKGGRALGMRAGAHRVGALPHTGARDAPRLYRRSVLRVLVGSQLWRGASHRRLERKADGDGAEGGLRRRRLAQRGRAAVV